MTGNVAYIGKNFLVIPGYTWDRNGGRWTLRWFSAKDLMILYRVGAWECKVDCCGQYHEEDEGLLHLEARFDWNYDLPTVEYDPCILYQRPDDVVQAFLYVCATRLSHAIGRCL